MEEVIGLKPDSILPHQTAHPVILTGNCTVLLNEAHDGIVLQADRVQLSVQVR